MAFARVRRFAIAAALVVCLVDAVSGALLAPTGAPPRMAAYDSLPVLRTPPQPLATTSFPTYAPTPHVTPVEPTVGPPTTTATVRPPTLAPTVAPEAPTTTQPPASSPRSSDIEIASTQPSTIATVVKDRAIVFDAPKGKALYSLLRENEFGNQRVFLVSTQQDGWLQVQLPLPPNGFTAWIRESDVVLSTVTDRIDVSLTQRRLWWSRGGELLLEATVAIGAPNTPTPAHSYYVTDVLPQDPNGVYGAWIVALNGYSESFSTFDGGLPRLGIHGTNEPGSIGAAASNGCLRAGAGDLAKLAAGVPIGTPVVVVP